MADRRIINHIIQSLRAYKALKPDNRAPLEVIAEVAALAYEEAREAIPNPDEPARFTVAGRGIFPADMLRHDHCWPVDGDMNRVTDPTVRLGQDKDTMVVLCAQSRRRITPARWASFGWTVIDIAGEPTHG